MGRVALPFVSASSFPLLSCKSRAPSLATFGPWRSLLFLYISTAL